MLEEAALGTNMKAAEEEVMEVVLLLDTVEALSEAPPARQLTSISMHPVLTNLVRTEAVDMEDTRPMDMGVEVDEEVEMGADRRRRSKSEKVLDVTGKKQGAS